MKKRAIWFLFVTTVSANNFYKNLKLNNLKGDFQLENASTALTAIEALNKFHNLKINKNIIKNGLRNAKWEGRFEFLGRNILIDCAHNPSGFEVLIKEIKKLDYKKLILVTGLMKDKDIEKIIEMLNPVADYFIITKAKNERAAEPEFISQFIKKPFKIIKNPKNALKYAKNIADKKDLVLVAGSIYVAGELL